VVIEPLESRWLLAGDLVEWARLLPTADAADTQHSGDGFGVSVAIDGDTAVVGAYADGGERPLAGAAYVFTRDGSDWELQQKLTASDAQLFDYFGYAVAISGETILVGAMLHDDGGVSDSGAAYVFTRSAGVWTEQQKLVASDAGAEDRFGGFVAIDGDTAVVGAFGDDRAAGTDAGSAYVFVGSGGVWAEQQQLTAPDAAAGDSFGVGLGLDGDTLIVGAYQKDLPSNPDAGAAYVYTLSGGVWSHQQTLTSPTPAAGDGFGNSVALRGETAVVGAYADDTAAGIDAGSGFVFTRSGSTWTAVQQISATDAAAGDGFGVSVRIDAGTIVVGSYQSDTAAGADAGAVYVFRESGGVWNQQQKLTASTAAAGDLLGLSAAVSGTTVLAGALRADTPFGTDSGAAYFFVDDGSAWSELQRVYQSDQDARGDTFGTAVAIDGTTLAVGAPQDDVAGVNAGAAYAFTRIGTDWTLQQKLTAPGLQPNDRFGWAIGVLGATLVVAAPRHAVGPAVEAGAVFVFARTGDDWTYRQTLSASDAAANDWFGISVTLGDGTLIVGAEGDDTGAGANAGSAYVFVVDANGVWSQQQKLTAADGAAGDQFGHAVTLDGDTVVVGAFQHNLFGWNDAGSAYVFVRSGTTWTEQQKLTAPVPYSGALFGSAVAIRGDLVLVGAEGVDVGFVPRAGAAHLFTRSGTQWSHQQQLSAMDPGSLDRFGSVVAVGPELLVVGANLRDSAAGSNVGSAFRFTSDGGTWSQQQELTGRDQYPSDQFGSAVAVSGPLVVVGAPLADLASGNSGGVYVFAPDDTQSPTITGTAPSLAASSILDAGTRSLVIEFSEAVLGGGDAGSYQLQSVGPDGLLGTADDTILPLSVTHLGTTATLVFPALPESVYRLTVRDVITDLVGNPLDGDGNGLPGGDARLEFTVVPPVGGLFPSSTEYLGAAYAYPRAIEGGDFNGDGVFDLVTVNSTGNVTLSLGDGAGGFTLAGPFPSGGSSPWGVTVGDFNGDGNSDLAVANTSSDSVGVLLGNGAGGFSATAVYATGGSSPWDVTVGDFNGDGNTDLAVANGANAGILLGNGAGGFGAAVTYATGGSSPRSVTARDFNGDGNDDLAIANSSSNNVGILFSDGMGGFTAAVTYPSGGSSPRTVIAGDFDGDGHTDIAVTNRSSRNVAILAGEGAGGFGTAVPYDTVGTSPDGVINDDFNGDGHADLVVGTSASVAVLLSNGAGGFAAAVTYTTGGSNPNYVAAGDFNQDGNPDLAVANYTSHNLSVLLGNGSGGFGAAATYAPGGASPEGAASGDFNGDGITDLAVANNSTNNVGVLLGNGAGGFATAVTFATGGLSPKSVATGDFNGDGNTDLVVANYGSNNVSVLLGNGAGGFDAATAYAAGGSAPSAVAVGDFNGDGNLDLAVTLQTSHKVGILLGNGAGGFGAAVTYATGGNSPVSVAIDDFNGDSKLDLAVANSIGGNVGILLGDGLGGFAAAATYSPGGSYPNSVAVGDFNADGKKDLAVAYTSKVAILLGDGAGAFGGAISYSPGSSVPKSVTIGDFNADGRDDVAVLVENNYSYHVSVMLGNGAGVLAAGVLHVIGGLSPTSLMLADFNGDGNHDLAVTNSTTHNVSILLGRGATGLAAAIPYATGGANPNSVAAADFNRDGKNDLVVVNYISRNVGVLLGNGAGGFAAPLTYGVGTSSPWAATVGDFNLDGKADIAYGRNGTNSIGVLLGNGAGGFTSNLSYLSGGTSPRFVAVGDFNQDGKPDLAAANYGSDTVGILLGDGTGAFAGSVTYATGGNTPNSVTVGDFNSDGLDDLAVANFGSNSVGVLLGDGDGGFAAAVTYFTDGISAYCATVGDFNADGRDDLAVINYGSDNVGVLLGDGNGGFAAAVAYASGGDGAYFVTTGDFNSDGKRDFAVAHYSSSSFGVLLGDGNGGFTPGISYASGGVSSPAAAVADFNADGRDDLAVANYGSLNVGIFLNTGQYRPSVQELDSPSAMRLAIQSRGFGAGQLVEGTGGAFDGMGRLEVAGQTYAPASADEYLADGGRTAVTPTVAIAGLYVSRKITVPDSGTEDFARTVDVLTNPGSQPITTTVRIVGNLGSDAATTVWKTSDGDTIVEPTDQWVGTDGAGATGAPAILHYIHGLAGLVPTTVSIDGDQGDNIQWTYEITVPAGETVRLVHFTILAETRAAAEAAAATLVTSSGFGGQAAVFLTQDEQDSVINFAFDAPSDFTINADEFSANADNGIILTQSGGRIVVTVDGQTVLDQAVSTLNSLTINGQTGNDTLTVDFSDGNPIPPGGVSYDGGTGADALALTGGSATEVSFGFINAHDGSVTIDGRTIGYCNLEPITSDIQATHVTLDYSTTGETITVQQDSSDTAKTLVTSTLPPSGESVSFLNPTGTLTINAGDTGDDIVDVNGFGTSNGGAPGALTITGGTGADDVNVNVGISLGGAGALSITAETIDVAAVTVFTADGSQSYFGALSVSASTLQTTGTGSVILGGDATVSGSAAAGIHGKLNLGGATRTFNVADVTGDAGSDLTISAVIDNGGLDKTGGGTLSLTGTNAYSGGSTISSGTLQVGNGGTTGSLGSGSVTNSGTLTFFRNNGYTISNAIGGAGTLIFSGTGVSGESSYALATTNTFTGSVYVNNARLSVAAADRLGTASMVHVSSGGQLRVTGPSVTYSRPLTLSGMGWPETFGRFGALRFDAGNSPPTWAGDIALAAEARIGVYNSDVGRVTGNISGSYQLELWGNGFSDTIMLAPATGNTYTSTKLTTLSAVVGKEDAFSTGGLLMNGAWLNLNGYNQAFGNLSGSSGSIANSHPTTAATLTVGSDGTDTSYGGTIDSHGWSYQPLAVAKVGTGKLTLTGNNTYTGSTTISGGTLLANNASGSATGADPAAVFIRSGSVFGGTGSVATDVWVPGGDSGTVAPGDPGAADTTDDLGVQTLVLSGNSAYLSIEIDGTAAGAFDRVVAAGGVRLVSNPNLTLTKLSGYTVTPGDAFVIVKNDSAASVDGTFAGLAEGAAIPNFLGSAYTAHITYQGGDGNDVVLTVDYVVEVRLVPLQAASGTDTLVTLPDSVTQLDAGDDFFLEVWVQDMQHKVGVQGGYVTLTNLTQAAQAQALNHGGVFDLLTSGTINNPQWQVESFGGGTLDGGQGANPNWARLGYVRYEATAGGEILFESAAGNLQFSLSGIGNISPQDINFGSVSLTSLPQLSIAGVTRAEGNSGTTDFEFVVTLSHPSNQEVTVAYTTQDGTATVDDNDYQFTTGTLTFEPGQMQKTIVVPVNGDLKVEDDETFSVILSNPTGATITQDTAAGTITNNDTATISIAPPNRQLTEGNAGLKPFEFTVTLLASIDLPVTVRVDTADGTATTADNDYQARTNLVLTFTPGGALEQMFSVNVVGDTKGEADETFGVQLSEPLWDGAPDARISLAVAQATGTIVNDDALVAVQVVAVAAPSAGGTTAPPSSLDLITLGSTYYFEVWVQDRMDPGAGISGGSVDAGYTTSIVDGVAVFHDFDDISPTGTIDDANGVVQDLGGGTLSGGVGISPQWARMAYVQVRATGLGDATFDLSAGDFQFSRFGEGNVAWEFVDLGTPVVVEQTGGTQMDLRIVRTPTTVPGNGEVANLPAGVPWVHEWESFWVEVWVSTPNTTTLGVGSATVDLHYNTGYLTAQEIQYGPAFTLNRTGTIADALGRVTTLGGETNLTNVGDDAFVLLARVRFASTGADQVPVDELGRHIGPYDMQMALADGQTQLVGIGAAVPEFGMPPATELWAVVYDIDDNDLIDFGDLSFFAPAFSQTMGLPGSEPPYVWWADFDKTGLVDFGDLSYFAPNFAKGRGDGTAIVFAPNFPDAWRGETGEGIAPAFDGAGSGEGVVLVLGGTGAEEMASTAGRELGFEGSQQLQAAPLVMAVATNEERAAARQNLEPPLPVTLDALPNAEADGFGRRDALPRIDRVRAVTAEAFAQIGSEHDERWATGWLAGAGRESARSERPQRPADRWEPLEDVLSLLAEQASDRLLGDMPGPRDALFARTGR
jgi:autotransporter-associated beta strand protein